MLLQLVFSGSCCISSPETQSLLLFIQYFCQKHLPLLLPFYFSVSFIDCLLVLIMFLPLCWFYTHTYTHKHTLTRIHRSRETNTVFGCDEVLAGDSCAGGPELAAALHLGWSAHFSSLGADSGWDELIVTPSGHYTATPIIEKVSTAAERLRQAGFWLGVDSFYDFSVGVFVCESKSVDFSHNKYCQSAFEQGKQSSAVPDQCLWSVLHSVGE